MSEPRYPGVADAEPTRAAEGRSDGRDGYAADPRAAESHRSRYSDPYGTPAGAEAAGAAPRRSGYGQPAAGEPSSYGGGRSRSEPARPYTEYGDAAGRGGYGAGSPSHAAPAPSAQPGSYPSTTYSAGTTYDNTGGRATYDTRSRNARPPAGHAAPTGHGVPTGQAGRGAPSPASRVASAMRRSVSAAAKGPRRARLQLKHIDPWSTLKLSLVLAVALFVVWMVAVGLLYGVLDGMGVFDKINGLYQDVTGKGSAQIVGPGLVLGTAALIGAINIVLFTALATVGSFVYNMCADLVGGVEVTLSEHD
ncbi:MAG TPA: DUF3566 domain-containing protein [Mycobacteriales bacterium]